MAQTVITGEKRVDAHVKDGSIWVSIRTPNGLVQAETSCSKENAVAIATMLLNAAQKLK